MSVCRNCGAPIEGSFCANCGASSAKPRKPPAWPHGFMIVFLIATALCFIMGWVAAESAVQQCAWFASGAVLGILARMAQAAASGR